MLQYNSRIFITGHRGLVGSALLRALEAEGFTQVLTAGREELDLRDQRAVSDWFAEQRPEFVIHAAGKVGGIQANSEYPADFLYENTLIHATVLHASRETGVEKLLYLGSSCIYPRECPQPMKEEYLLTGPLEQTKYLLWTPHRLARGQFLHQYQDLSLQDYTEFVSTKVATLDLIGQICTRASQNCR